MSRAILLGMLPLVSACYTIHYVYEPTRMPTPDREVWNNRVLWGMVEFDAPVRIDAICPNGFAEVKTEISVLNGLADWGVTFLVSSVTVGTLSWVDVYSPSTISVWCADGTAYRGVLEEDGLVHDVEAVASEHPVPGWSEAP